MLGNLPCKRIQADEIWTFVYARRRMFQQEHRGQFGYGNVWTWTALCADTKIILRGTWGRATRTLATLSCSDLSSRLANKIQLTTDGHHAYLAAVDRAFGWAGSTTRCWSNSTASAGSRAALQSSGLPRNGAKRHPRHPDPAHISTSMSSARTFRCGWESAASRG